MKTLTTAGTTLLCLLMLCEASYAHPSHIAFAEVEVTDGRLEVALQLQSEDVERLTRHETIPREEMLRRLIARRFEVSRDQAKPRPHRWIGVEDKRSHVWVYFEVALNGPLKGHHLRFDLLLSHHPRQVNTVLLREGKRRRTLTFTSQRATQPL